MSRWTTNINRPWPDQESFWDEVSQLFNNDQGRWSNGTAFPKVNIYKNSDGAVVTAEVPGVDPDHIYNDDFGV